MSFDPAGVGALAFDVFGTVVDWRTSVIREGEMLGQRLGITLDWPAFADAWRAGYQPAMARVRRGDLAWTNIDGLHRGVLDALFAERGIVVPEVEVERFNRVWHRLIPWPDSVPGLHRLRPHYALATLSNGNVSLLVDMARHAALPWDCVLSAELFGHYKPDPEVYLGAAKLLDLAPAQLMMVAAHPSDLHAAAACGLRTAYVARPLEYGAGAATPPWRAGEFDLVADDFIDLARQLLAQDRPP